jgi:histidinol dehydrogenase
MGGAHAIAAMAYGTEQVPQVDKIVGVGGAHVTQAQRQIFGVASIQHQAGPTELCIVADRAATPAWIAADAISHAEKDENAQVVLITNGKGLATKVQEQVNRQLKNFPSADAVKTALSTRGVIVVTRNVAESIKLANEYAPEHLVLAIDEPEQQIKHVTNAGAVFLGHYTPVAVGDYLAGPNSVLPTGGTARFASPLGVEDFLKRMAFVKFESPKLRELGADVIRLAEVEGLSGSAKAVDLRLQKIRRARREREAAREVEMEL